MKIRLSISDFPQMILVTWWMIGGISPNKYLSQSGLSRRTSLQILHNDLISKYEEMNINLENDISWLKMLRVGSRGARKSNKGCWTCKRASFTYILNLRTNLRREKNWMWPESSQLSKLSSYKEKLRRVWRQAGLAWARRWTKSISIMERRPNDS